MRISVPERGRAKSGRYNAGFSLLEMLIVLTIMGLMLSLVGTRFITTIESTRFSRTADAGISSIKLLRAEAMLGNFPLHVVSAGKQSELAKVPNHQIRRLNLPEGWSVNGDNIFISKTGVCGGGKVILQGPTKRRAAYRLDPPLCAPRRTDLP